jgi:hypothetical protein
MNPRKYTTISILSLMSYFMISCTEVIHIDLNSSNPVIVAEGYVEADSAASLRLTYTTDYYNMEAARVIEDARISVMDQGGNSEELNYQGNGVYTGEQLKGTVYSNYTLTIEVDGKTYSGSSSLFPAADIASISYAELLLGNPEMTELLGYTLNVAFDAIPDLDSYYALKIKKNGIYAASTYGLASTRINDEGNNVYESGSFFVMPGDTIDMAVYSIDFDAYTFYSQVNEGLSGNMILSPAPFNASSNLGEDILGYFMARSRTDTTFIVPTLP